MDVTTLPELASAEEVSEVDGGTFTDRQVWASCSAIRRRAGWHIAPSLTETVVLDHDGAQVLRLPSLYVTDVSSVEDLTGAEPREITGYRWSRAGMIEGSLPSGFSAVRVTFTHGYAACPADLLRLIASRANRRKMQETVGSVSVTYGAEADRAVEDSLFAYMLGPRA